MHTAGMPALAPFEQKSTTMQTATITPAQNNDVTPDIATQLSNYYQTHGLHGNLYQFAPHTTVGATQTLPNIVNSSTLTAGIPLLNTLDCRSLQPHSMPNILTPPDVTISTMSCLTPISETFSRSEENLDSSGVSSLPEGKTFNATNKWNFVNFLSLEGVFNYFEYSQNGFSGMASEKRWLQKFELSFSQQKIWYSN